MNLVFKVTYQNRITGQKVIMEFFDNDEVEYLAEGTEVSADELQMLADAGGQDVGNWVSTIQ